MKNKRKLLALFLFCALALITVPHLDYDYLPSTYKMLNTIEEKTGTIDKKNAIMYQNTAHTRYYFRGTLLRTHRPIWLKINKKRNHLSIVEISADSSVYDLSFGGFEPLRKVLRFNA